MLDNHFKKGHIKKITFAPATSQAIAPDGFRWERKVRTAKSNAPVKSRVLSNQEQKVPQKITADAESLV